ncbi:MAG: YybH family protein, partial [Candidatus Levyibacteriota bacterium]
MDSEKIIEEIRELIEQWTEAILHEDMDKILAHHAKDIMMFDVPPPFQSKGIDAYKKTWELFFSWAKKPVEFTITEIKITASDTVAFWHGIGHCSSTNSKWEEENIEFRLTVG